MVIGQNKGFSVERKIKASIDNKRFNEIDPTFRSILIKINNKISSDAIFTVGKASVSQIGLFKKTDIYILMNDQYFSNLSIKKGKSNSVHQENIYSFCEFMGSIGANLFEIDAIKKYHWGDGSLDGSIGKTDISKRKCYGPLKVAFAKEINIINSTFTKFNEKILRRVFLGGLSKNVPDFLIYTQNENLNQVKIMSMEDVINFHKSNFDTREKYVTLGNLTFQNWNRCCSGQDLKPNANKHRNDIQFKWNLINDINHI